MSAAEGIEPTAMRLKAQRLIAELSVSAIFFILLIAIYPPLALSSCVNFVFCRGVVVATLA